MNSTRPLTPEEMRAQMEWMNNSEERKLGEDAFGTLNEGRRPLSASSNAAFEAKEKEVQKVNDQAIADLIAKDVAEGPLPVSNTSTQKDTTDAHETKVSHISHGNNIIKPNVFRPQQRSSACLAKLHPQITESVLSPYLDNNRELTSLSRSCITLYAQTEKTRQRHAFLAYMQAMLHDQPSEVSHILASYPNFLLAKPKDYGITEIQSHYTWLRYLPKEESVFSMAQKLQLIDVVQVIFPHYVKELQDAQNREDKPHISELENAWVMQVSTLEEQKALQKKYTDEFILPVVKALGANTALQLRWTKNPETGLFEATIQNYNEGTLTALKILRNKLFEPKSFTNLIDVEQLLIAAYNACDIEFHTLQNATIRNAYAVLVIGLIQSLVEPKLGKIFSQSLHKVIAENELISDKAQLLKLIDGRPYYRSRENSTQGLGFTFLCCDYHGISSSNAPYLANPVGLLKNYVDQRQKIVSYVCNEYSSIAARPQQSHRGA